MLVVNVVAVALLVAVANARPYQYIPEVPGWIPVYIRQGDQPLSEIHPALAEAFNDNIQQIRLDDSANKNLLAEGNEISAELEPTKEKEEPIGVNSSEKNDFPQKTFDRDSVVMKIPKPSELYKAELKRLVKELKHNKKNE